MVFQLPSTSHLLHTTFFLIPLLLCILVLAQALVVSSASSDVVAAAAEGTSGTATSASASTTATSSKPAKPLPIITTKPIIITKPTTTTKPPPPPPKQVVLEGKGSGSGIGGIGGNNVKSINKPPPMPNIAFDSKFKKIGTPPPLNADPAIATAEKQALQLLRFKQRSSMLEKFTMLMKDETFKNITDFKVI